MKKKLVHPAFLFTLLVTLFMFSACESEEEIKEADLIGTWAFEETTFDFSIGGVGLKQFLMTSMMLSDSEAQSIVDQFESEMDEFYGTITFNEDNTYVLTDDDYEETGTWEMSEDGKSLYVIETNDDNEPEPLKIKSLTSSSMTLSWEEEEKVDMDDDGTDETTVTIAFEVKLSKQ